MKVHPTAARTFCTMMLVALVTSALLVGSGPAQAETSGPTPYPSPKNEKAWPGKGPIRFFKQWMPGDRIRFWKARQKDQGKIVFTGDSIIAGWKLETDFSDKLVANRGIGGDVTRGLLFRFKEDVLDLHPKAIVMEIGSNDITADASVANVVSNYNMLLDMAQKANPNTPIIIMALTPHGIPTGAKAPSPALEAYLKKVNARIPVLNRELAKIPAQRKNVIYVDTYSPFLLPNGKQDESQFNDDKVHPTKAGHSKLAKIVGEALKKLNLL